MNRLRQPWFSVLVLVASVSLPRTLMGQQPQQQDTTKLRQAAEARLGRPVTQAEILTQLRESGISRAEARARLQQLGYDPSLVDPYFDALEGGAAPTGSPSDQFVSALERMGIAQKTVAGAPEASPVPANETGPGLTPSGNQQPGQPGATVIFGRSLFQRPTSQFSPMTSGPVDPSYRLGPGDRLKLILTGDVEKAYELEVTREGYLVIPDVGEVLVNGLTLAQLDDLMYARLGRVYSGVRRSGGSTRFQVSMDQVRAIQVYLVGDVERPGAYQVSALSGVFDALYRAGGPSERGSYRRIELRRAGSVSQNIDLYNYLLHGDSRDDVRLEQGDIIFVPVAERVVKLDGAVRRAATYELKSGEALQDLIRFAGGLQADAIVRRVQIDRVLPPEGRRPGIDRVLMDVDVAQAESGAAVPLQDADVVHVFAVSDERRHRVVLTGGVNRPGIYEWSPGITLWQLVDRAQGLDEQAYTSRAHIYRLNPEDGSRRIIRVPLVADSGGHGLRDVVLQDRDSIVVFSVASLANATFVNIAGYVKNPGNYPLADGMTLEDLILAAGGFQRGAEIASAEVARHTSIANRSDTTAYVVRVPLQAAAEKGSPSDSSSVGMPGRSVPVWSPSGLEFPLQDGDQVFVRRAPGYGSARAVGVTGEVLTPGTYVLRDRQERLSDILDRTGGLTRQAYPAGMQLFRQGRLLPIDLARALREPAGRYNVVLEDRDSIHIPAYDPTVTVMGRVAFESRVLFRPGEGMGYYLSQAGGLADGADFGRTSVTYANGERAGLRRFLLFRRAPAIRPGTIIVVPTKASDKGGVNWDSVLSRTLAVMSTLATVLIAYDRLK